MNTLYVHVFSRCVNNCVSLGWMDSIFDFPLVVVSRLINGSEKKRANVISVVPCCASHLLPRAWRTDISKKPIEKGT